MYTKHILENRLISSLLLASMLVWSMWVPLLVQQAYAVNLIYLKDTLQDSDLSVASNHEFQFQAPSGVANGGTVTITFPSQFTMGSVAATDIDVATTTAGNIRQYSVGTDCTGTDMVGISVSGQVVTITFCSGDGGLLPAYATTTIYVGTNASSSSGSAGAPTNNRVTNPAAAGSYEFILTAGSDTGALRVAIIDDVVVTASVATSFTFVIEGLATSTTVNGELTTGSTTATVMNFSTTTVNSAETMGQRLRVTTNAVHGFVVTVQMNQNLLSSNGADIDMFKDGAMTHTPTAWTAPAGILNAEQTYGHFGVTSEDDLNSSEFGTQLFAGDFQATGTGRAIFENNGPSDGSTNNIGSTSVAYKLEVSALQEAADDYTATLTYVATPIF